MKKRNITKRKNRRGKRNLIRKISLIRKNPSRLISLMKNQNILKRMRMKCIMEMRKTTTKRRRITIERKKT